MTKRRFRGLFLRGVMTGDVDALLCAFILTMLACACACGGGGEARVRLNSIRTVVVHKGPEASFNRSAWELTLRQCISDLECNEGSYCHAPYRSSAHSRCRTCRRRKKRCHRDGMCCPGNFCSNSVCVREATAAQQIALQHVAPSPKARWRKRDKMQLRGASGQGQVGDPCLTSADCWDDELCCARHLWTRICKPVLQEGQVCSARRRKRRQGGLELFQRCPCAQGLGCRAPPAAGPPSSPLMAAAKSKLAPYSRRPRPHAVKARLHECRRK